LPCAVDRREKENLESRPKRCERGTRGAERRKTHPLFARGEEKGIRGEEVFKGGVEEEVFVAKLTRPGKLYWRQYIAISRRRRKDGGRERGPSPGKEKRQQYGED